MSMNVNGRNMINAGVNTDPLQFMMSSEVKKSHYGLKERNIPHMKINEMKELKVWYEFGEKLGEGGFGIVMAVTEKANNKVWAMKTVSKSTAGDRLRLVQQEIQVLKLITHPHIIYLDKIFESAKFMYMIFEKCHGDFAPIYEKRKPFQEKIAKKIISELVDAVAYLHKYDIVHRDLKMENILLGENPNDPDDEYYIKLTDFGLSIVKFGKGFESSLHDYCGTIFYMAPEMITKRSYTQMCDMWAVGVILYMLVTGRFPFFAQNEKELQNVIRTQEPARHNIQLSAEVTNLISLLLVKDPVNRIRATEVLQHPWLQNKKLSKNLDYNILNKMKEWRAELKVGAEGTTSSWVAESFEQLQRTKSQSKQPLLLPKTNVQFERNKKLGRHRSSSVKETAINFRNPAKQTDINQRKT